MPILSKSPVTKGTPAAFTLDVAALALHSSVIADAYYSDTAKWKHVSLTYKSSTSNQGKLLLFNVANNEITTDFKTSLTCDALFQVQNITIHDFDGGSLVLRRTALTVVDLDVSAPVAPVTSSWDSLQGFMATNGDGELHRSGGSSDWAHFGSISQAISGDFTFTAMLSYLGSDDVMIGYATSTGLNSSGDFLSKIKRAMYFHSTLTVYNYDGVSGSNIGSISGFSGSGVYTCEIKRVSGVITLKVNGVQFVTTETYSGDVYIGAGIYQYTTTCTILSATLVN